MARNIAIILLTVCGIALIHSEAASTRPRAFEVVSVRPSKLNAPSSFNPTFSPNGYRATGQSTFMTLMIAYYPQGKAYWSKDLISGSPKWLNDLYDINAKVSDADLADWQKQGTSLVKEPMLREMLQTMLSDRFHLVAHIVPGQHLSGWSLELGKRVPNFKQSKPGQKLPEGLKLPSGGVMAPFQGGKAHLDFYGATMADLADMLSMFANKPVQDRTGLTGQYDFVVDWNSNPDSKIPEGFVSSDDPDPLSHWNIEGLGIKHTPVDVPIDTLVIDHIEKPSEN